ncbi:MAG: hypothetical protein WC554_19140 [Clostridia bacterium]|jgi:predicted RNA-binding Zn-ribbon protein involved in translation (DUF1610 family)
MKCYAKSCGAEMVTDEKRIIIKGNLYHKYECPKCGAKRMKVLREEEKKENV